MPRLLSCALCLLATVPALADVKPHAGMLRYPDVSASHVAFVYANDIWIAPRTGGVATPLASPPGSEQFPRFSADGKTIAFVGNYDGNRDLYTISIDGGVPVRVTHHPAAETLCDWTPDGRLLFFYNGQAGLQRQVQLFTTAAAGGLPEQLPVPYGAFGSISPDGAWLAYTPHTIDFRTWKRYRGGMATDIWLFNLKDHSSKRITEFDGTDSLPMWNGKTVYYLSDEGPSHKLNIWAYDTASAKREQITRFDEFDVKWPSIGPGPAGKGELIFQYGSELRLLDLATRQPTTLQIIIPGDRPRIRPRQVETNGLIASWDISPTGKRAIVEARGDVYTIPAQKGSPRNLTRTTGVAERDPVWSPDGKWIAYFSDASGEYELYLAPGDETGAAKRVTTSDPKAYDQPFDKLDRAALPSYYRTMKRFSPDSKKLVFGDIAGALYLHDVDTGQTRRFDVDPWAGSPGVSWSHDSNWVAYSKGGENRQSAIWLYRVDTDELHQVTSGVFNDTWPVFDRKGDFLYFASSREFSSPMYEDLGTSFIYADLDHLYAVPLRKDVKSPYLPKSDEEEPKKEEAKSDAASQPATATVSAPASSAPASSGPASSAEADKKPLVIDLDGFERRAVELPMRRGNFSQLAVNHDGKLLYVRQPARGGGGGAAIKLFDVNDEKKEEKTVLDGAGFFVMSSDGKKILTRVGGATAIVDAGPDQKMDKPMSLAGMSATIDAREEWRQIFTDAWRIMRDYFYVPNMHGLDWPKLREQYAAMLPDCVCREDVSYIIAELISELNVGHAYLAGQGDVESQPSQSVGMLGCDFALADGAYRITKIQEGGAWDADARGPLSQPGVDVKEGDYLLAVNGVALDTRKDPWAAFQGLAGRTVTLTVSEHPQLDDKARRVVVDLMGGEADVRYRAWVESKRKYVADRTDGKVGYVYVPNTGIQGQNELFRQFYGQVDKAALIIDERWNGGGQIPTRFIELLNRPVTNYWARRHGNDWTWPPDSMQGPKCMLINGLAGSGGDMFPWLFRYNKIGKLIGMRTWGGLVGISGNPGLIDGGSITVPTFGFYETDGTWGVEGHGIDPDIEVIDDPARMTDGGDPQLDAAITLMLDEIKAHPYVPAKRPPAPDRRGMGLRPEDK